MTGLKNTTKYTSGENTTCQSLRYLNSPRRLVKGKPMKSRLRETTHLPRIPALNPYFDIYLC